QRRERDLLSGRAAWPHGDPSGPSEYGSAGLPQERRQNGGGLTSVTPTPSGDPRARALASSKPYADFTRDSAEGISDAPDSSLHSWPQSRHFWTTTRESISAYEAYVRRCTFVANRLQPTALAARLKNSDHFPHGAHAIAPSNHPNDRSNALMATLAFLLAPSRPIPDAHDQHWMAVVSSWLHIAHGKWVRMREALPEAQRRGVPRFPPGTGLSSNMADASLRKDPALMANAEPWMERAWTEWRSSNGRTPFPVVDAAAAHEALGLDSRISLAHLIGYAGGLPAVPPS